MRAELLHIWGPISIYSFGVAIAIGLVTFVLMLSRDSRYKQLHMESFLVDLIMLGIAGALVGSRLLNWFTEPENFSHWTELLMIWQGGFSVLGAILGVAAVIPWYLYYYRIPIVPVLDTLAIYTPLLQSIARLGCLFAGCCFGSSCSYPWAVIYSDPRSIAPQGVPLYPAQVYSSAVLFLIFLSMYFYGRHRLQKAGQLTCMYFMLVSIERFIVDFWRADQAYFAWDTTHYLCANQYIAGGICITALLLFLYVTFRKSPHHAHE